jgi:hypothetical protein
LKLCYLRVYWCLLYIYIRIITSSGSIAGLENVDYAQDVFAEDALPPESVLTQF